MDMAIFRPVVSVAVAVSMAIAGATAGQASGGYKIEFSFNCNNPMCLQLPGVGAIGGDWGSITLNADGSGTAQFTSAVHSTPGQPTGAVHFELVLSWATVRSATPPAAAVAPDPNGSYLTITVVNFPALGSLVTPATPGRYSLNGNEFGIPGLVYMINIGAT
jgi:hypothetical protein